MKITSIKKGTRLLNKVNGKTYEVTELQKVQDVLTGTAVSVNPETDATYASTDTEYDTVAITEANDICFRTLFIPEDTTVPTGYSVKEGLLLDGTDAKVTEQGQIYVKRIIRALPGYLVLAVKPREEKEGYIDLFIYRPEKDEFKKLIHTSIPDPIVVLDPSEDSVVLGYNATHQEEVSNEFGIPTGEMKEIFDGAALIMVKDRTAGVISFCRPMDFSSKVKVAGDDELFLFGSTMRVVDENVVEKSDWFYQLIGISANSFFGTNNIFMPHGRILTAASVKLPGKGIVLKGDDFIQCGDIRIDSPLVQQITGQYLVDVTHEDHAVILTFADEKYNTSRIKRQNTKDRGYIVSLI